MSMATHLIASAENQGPIGPFLKYIEKWANPSFEVPGKLLINHTSSKMGTIQGCHTKNA